MYRRTDKQIGWRNYYKIINKKRHRETDKRTDGRSENKATQTDRQTDRVESYKKKYF